MNEITMPLYRILTLIDIEKQQQFKDYVSLIEMSRVDEDSDSIEAEIITALKETPDGILAITIKELAYILNTDKNEKEKYSSNLIGVRMKRLGFTSKKISGKRGYLIDFDLLDKLVVRYNL
ncbi:hypothetical protein ES703_106857 [subsurface metagenome]